MGGKASREPETATARFSEVRREKLAFVAYSHGLAGAHMSGHKLLCWIGEYSRANTDRWGVQLRLSANRDKHTEVPAEHAFPGNCSSLKSNRAATSRNCTNV